MESRRIMTPNQQSARVPVIQIKIKAWAVVMDGDVFDITHWSATTRNSAIQLFVHSWWPKPFPWKEAVKAGYKVVPIEIRTLYKTDL
jgi:hypothetical protein